MGSKGASLKLYCSCGTLIWDVPGKKSLSRYVESIVCSNCGRDWSRQPPIMWRVRQAWRRFKRRKKLFGWVGMWRQAYPMGLWQVRSPGPPAKTE